MSAVNSVDAVAGFCVVDAGVGVGAVGAAARGRGRARGGAWADNTTAHVSPMKPATMSLFILYKNTATGGRFPASRRVLRIS